MTDGNEQLSPKSLVTLLRQQRTLHRQLRILSERQKTLLSRDDTEMLLKMLAERQRLVDGLVDLNARLAPYRAHWTTFYGGLEETHRKEVSELLEEVNGSLAAILQSDRRDTATLTAKRQSMAGRMAAFDAGSRAMSAYGKEAAARPSNVTDEKA